MAQVHIVLTKLKSDLTLASQELDTVIPLNASNKELLVVHAHSEEVDEFLSIIRSLKLELKQVKRAHLTVLNNLKAVAFKEAIQFLKQKSELVEKVMTQNHQKVIR